MDKFILHCKPENLILAANAFPGFTARLAKAWDARTSNDAANWNTKRPAHGQCAVSALLVQDIFGGELMRGEFDGGSHYWNRLGDGSEIDVTSSQFDCVPHFRNVAVRSRSYVLSNPATVARYNLLRARFNAELGKVRTTKDVKQRRHCWVWGSLLLRKKKQREYYGERGKV